MISSAWRDAFSTSISHDTRCYFNPRGIEYPAISDTLTYSQDEWLGGVWCASGGTATYLIDCTQPVIVSAMVKVQAASNYIFRWYTGSTNLFGLYTDGTSRIAGAFNNGTAYATSYVTVGSAWVKVDLLIASNQMTLWVNNAKYGPTAIGAIAAQLPTLQVNAATAMIRNLRIIKYAAAEADVTSMYSGIKNSEIYGDFAKRAILQERCNITDYFNSWSMDSDIDYSATRATIELHNHDGAFTDDIYATFAPTTGDYNGTASQEYLQRRIAFWVEEYLPSAYSMMKCFHGYASPGAFPRSSAPGEGSSVSIKAIDFTADLAKRTVRKSRNWTDLLIADSTDDANSLFHQIAFLGTKKEIYNYACNSSFENATISNSWYTTGGTLTRTSGGLFGSYYGALATNGANTLQRCNIAVSSGERFTFQILISGNATVTLRLRDLTGGTANGTTTAAVAVTTAEGWKLASITHDVNSSASDNIRFDVTLTTGTAVGLDAVFVSYGDSKYWYINNTNDGAAGVCSYTQAMSGTYPIVGVHSDTVNYEHPYAVAEAGEKVWDLLSQVADASWAKYMRIMREGVLTLASNSTGTAETDNGAIEGNNGGISGLSAGNTSDIANKLKVQGVCINVKPNVECLWDARASGLIKDVTVTGIGFGKSVANGDYFPDLADSPTGYEALYSENNSPFKVNQ